MALDLFRFAAFFFVKHSQKERGEIWREKVDMEVRATNIVATCLLDGVTTMP